MKMLQARPDAQILNNAGRLRHLLAQYQTEFALEYIASAVASSECCEETLGAFPYRPAKDAAWYRDEFLRISAGLLADSEEGAYGRAIPAAPDLVVPPLRALQLELVRFDAARLAHLEGNRANLDEGFARSVEELTHHLENLNLKVVTPAADMFSQRADTLYLVFISTSVVGIVLIVAVSSLLSRELVERNNEGRLASKLLSLCVQFTASVSVEGVVIGCKEFEDLCGTTSLLTSLADESARPQVLTFLRGLMRSGEPAKIALTLRSKRPLELVHLNLCGAHYKVGSPSCLEIGFQIIDVRNETPLQVESFEQSGSESDGTESAPVVAFAIPGDSDQGSAIASKHSAKSISQSSKKTWKTWKTQSAGAREVGVEIRNLPGAARVHGYSF